MRYAHLAGDPLDDFGAQIEGRVLAGRKARRRAVAREQGLGVAPVVGAVASAGINRLFGGRSPRDPSLDNDEVIRGLVRLGAAALRTAASGGVVLNVPQEDGGVWSSINFGETSAARTTQRARAAQLVAEMEAGSPLSVPTAPSLTGRASAAFEEAVRSGMIDPAALQRVNAVARSVADTTGTAAGAAQRNIRTSWRRRITCVRAVTSIKRASGCGAGVMAAT